MKIVQTIEEMRRQVADARSAGRLVGLVPTMGALHEGHLSLLDAARAECGFVVVTIFVNPTQFGPGEDLSAYPRTPEADLAACRARGADAVFMPSVDEMYPRPAATRVTVDALSRTLCGRSRPGHFAGVCTVVAKLFHSVPADRAYFGAKDYQQTVVIRRMAADLNSPIEIVVCPTVREADGLALSSRNRYLTGDQRRQAGALWASLQLAERMIRDRRPPAEEVIAAMGGLLAERAPEGIIEYVQIVDPDDLSDVQTTRGRVLVALAVKIDRARLIDNIVVDASRQEG